jgi:hypothetical protein
MQCSSSPFSLGPSPRCRGSCCCFIPLTSTKRCCWSYQRDESRPAAVCLPMTCPPSRALPSTDRPLLIGRAAVSISQPASRPVCHTSFTQGADSLSNPTHTQSELSDYCPAAFCRFLLNQLLLVWLLHSVVVFHRCFMPRPAVYLPATYPPWQWQ